jgi:hypothetical protein
VLDRLSKISARIIAMILLVMSVASGAAFAQTSNVPKVKDQGEYDLTQAIQKEKDPQKQLELLKQWEQEYPDSDFRGQRSLAMAQADSQIMKGLRVKATVAEVDAAKNAAIDLLNNIDRYLAPENKPIAISDDQWKRVRQELEQQSRAVLNK